MTYIDRNREIIKLRNQGLTFNQIGNMYGITRQRVEQIIKKRNSPEQIKGRGTLIIRYPQLKKLEGLDYQRELVRIRDNHTCQMCGKKWKKGTRRFDIHHLDCDSKKTKLYSANKDFENLITFCHKCHLSFHYIIKRTK